MLPQVVDLLLQIGIGHLDWILLIFQLLQYQSAVYQMLQCLLLQSSFAW